MGGPQKSPPYTLDQADYVLLVSGGDGLQNTYVALVDAQGGEELTRRTGKKDNAFERVQVDCSAWKGKTVFLRIVDKATGPWGHINFGGMYEDPLKLFEN